MRGPASLSAPGRTQGRRLGDAITPSERVAITDAVRAEIGNRQGQRTDLTPDDDEPELPIEEAALLADLPEVAIGKTTRDVAAKAAGFSSTSSYRQAKAVVQRGTPELVEKMDRGEVSISTAAEIAKLPTVTKASAIVVTLLLRVAASGAAGAIGHGRRGLRRTSKGSAI